MRATAALALLAAAPGWIATSVGTPPGHHGASVQATAVNASGTVIAIGNEGAGTTARMQAFVWRKGRKTTLAYHGRRDVDPFAIDAAGDVLGTAGTTAVLWRKGVPTALGAFSPNGMSDDGANVVGVGFVDASGDPHAFLWRKGALTELPGLGGSETYANAVNGAGTVVGYSALPSGLDHAVVWRGGVATDLGTVPGLESFADDITAGGTIVGAASDHMGDSSTVVEWRNGRLVDLGRFGAGGARPAAVNARGDVLVQTQTASQNALGLVLLRGGKPIRVGVPALDGQHLWAVGLDDEGDVVGYGTATHRGFLWRNGRATLLPPDVEPRAVAGGWIAASTSEGEGVLLRLRGR